MINPTILDEEKIIEILAEDTSIDFIAIIVTKWHLYGLDILLNHNSILNKKKGLILVSKHRISGVILDVDKVQSTFPDHKVIIYEQTGSTLKVPFKLLFKLIRGNRTSMNLVLISPQQPAIRMAAKIIEKLMKKISYIVIDEGIGEVLKYSRYYYKGRERLVLGMAAFMKQVYYKLLSVTWMTLFETRNNKVVHSKIYDSYKKYLNYNLKNSSETVCFEKEYVLFIGATYTNTGEMSVSDEMDLLHLVKEMCDKKKLELYIKPHPRDSDVERFHGYNIIDRRETIEEFLCNCSRKPAFVLGYSSTALLTAKLFFDIQAISMVKLLDLHRLSGGAKCDARAFAQTIDQWVIIPNTLNEMQNIIS